MEREHRGFNIVPSGEINLKRITTIGKGSVPNELRGSFSTFGEAIKRIDLYLNRKEAKPDGKTK